MSSDDSNLSNSIRSLGRTLWLCLALLACWLVIDLGYVFFSHQASERSNPSEVKQSQAPDEQAIALVEQGYWTIAGDSRPVMIRKVSEAEVDVEIETELPPGLPALANTAALANKLTSLSQGDRAHRTEVGEYLRTKIEIGEIKLAYFMTKVQAQQQLVAVIAAIRGGEDWMVFETSSAQAAGEVALDQQPLMPLPDELTSLAVRYGLQGNRQAELSSGQTDLDALLKSWRNAGWTLSEPPGKPLSGGEHFLCSNGNQARYCSLKHQGEELVVFVVAMPAIAHGIAG